jgi:hypothetical protein
MIVLLNPPLPNFWKQRSQMLPYLYQSSRRWPQRQGFSANVNRSRTRSYSKEPRRLLGIRSVRDGFGAGRWLWQLPRVPRSTINLSGEPIGDTYPDEVSVEEVPAGRRIPSEWISGVASLQHRRAPPDIPRHRWRQFLSDCNNFLTSGKQWAERAAELGWDAKALFGCGRNRPLLHPGSAGLLWAINGGRLVELYKDWAIIELAVNGSRRVFERRRVDVAKVTLPWTQRG